MSTPPSSFACSVRFAIALGALGLGAVGCAGTPAAFATNFPDNQSGDVGVLLERVSSAPARQPTTIAVGVSSSPAQLYAFDLETRRMLWQKAVAATSAPELCGDAAVVQVGGDIVGFDLRSGARLFEASRDDKSLRGADGEGPVCAFTIGEGQGTFARSEVVLASSGSISWRREVDKLVGVPAVVGRTVLVPWSNQFLSAIDVASGDEYARVRVHDGVIAHAIREGSDVYVGSLHGITRVTASIGSGTLKGAGYFSLPARELPGRPLLLRDVYTMLAAPAPDSAEHRILLTWKPTAPDHVRIALQDDNVYLVFYRFVFALAPRDYAMRWVYVHDADLVGATAQENGLAFADDAGRFGFLGSASGELAFRVEGGPSSSVVRLPRSGAGVQDGGRAVDGATVPGKLLTAAHDQDARLVPARLLVVEELARLDVPEATANLIELCDASRLAPPVRERACALLKQRVIGADHLLFALERHAGYLEGTTSPPVGALAKAAASLKEKRAVALLIAHLKDPNTRSSDLPAVVTALGELEDPTAADPLVSFLRLYHADTIDEHMLKALELIPGVLVKLQGPVAKPPLEEVMYDELGAYTVRQKARAAVDGLAALEKAAQQSDEAAQAQQEQAVAEEAAANPDAYLPTHLTTELIEGALLPVRDPLRACLSGAAKRTFQARIVLVVEDGKVLMVSVLPPELQGCIEPLVRAQPFPRTKFAKQERLIYTLKR